jgi:allophanate hydrolase subunit 1
VFISAVLKITDIIPAISAVSVHFRAKKKDGSPETCRLQKEKNSLKKLFDSFLFSST